MIQKTKSSSSEPAPYPSIGNFTSTPAACRHLECQLILSFFAFSPLSAGPDMGKGGGYGSLFTLLLTLEGGARGSASTSGRSSELSSPTRVSLTTGFPQFTASPIGVTPSAVLLAFFFRSPLFFEFAAFHLAFVLVMPTLAAISAHNRAAEVVLVFRLLIVLGFRLALKL